MGASGVDLVIQAAGPFQRNGNHLVLSGNRAIYQYLDRIGAQRHLIGPEQTLFDFVDLKNGARWTLKPNDGPLPWWLGSPSRRLPGSPLHDPCAVAWLLWPDLVTARECSARVDLGPGIGRGRTVIDRWGRTGDPCNVTVLETLDAARFFARVGERLAALP